MDHLIEGKRPSTGFINKLFPPLMDFHRGKLFSSSPFSELINFNTNSRGTDSRGKKHSNTKTFRRGPYGRGHLLSTVTLKEARSTPRDESPRKQKATEWRALWTGSSEHSIQQQIKTKNHTQKHAKTSTKTIKLHGKKGKAIFYVRRRVSLMWRQNRESWCKDKYKLQTNAKPKMHDAWNVCVYVQIATFHLLPTFISRKSPGKRRYFDFNLTLVWIWMKIRDSIWNSRKLRVWLKFVNKNSGFD